jgi:hypothetical protein
MGPMITIRAGRPGDRDALTSGDHGEPIGLWAADLG